MQDNLKRVPLKFGLLTGIISVVYMMLFYWIDKKMMMGPWVYWSSVGIFILGMLWAVQKIKREQEDQISLRDALRTAFFVYLIADLVWYGFYYLLFNFIDPGMVEVSKQITLDSLEAYQASGQSHIGDQNITALIKQAESADYSVNLAILLPKLTYGVIGGFVLSLVLAMGLRTD